MKEKYLKFIKITMSSMLLLFCAQSLLAQVPSDLMRNCNQWKITYPDGEEDKTLCGESNNEYFYLNDAEDAIVFFVPIRSDNGSTANSDYIRSELREREQDGSDNIFWTTEGSHMLYVQQAITHLPLVKSHLVAAQIHGNKEDGIDDSMVLRLEDDHLFLSFNGGKLREDLTITRDYSLGTKHEVIFLVVDGKHYCYYAEDGNLLDSYTNGDASNYLVKDGSNDYVMDLNYDETYFKVGNYTQSNADREGDSTDDEDNYGEVLVYDFLVQHGTGSLDPVSVTGVSIASSTLDMTEGGSHQLNTVLSPANATDRGVSYSTDNNSVATVSASGEVTALAAGNVTITVSTDDGGFSDSISITVYAASTGANLSLGKSVTGTGTPDGANVASNLIDGDLDSRWAVSGMPQSATIDLGEIYSIDGTELVCYEDRAYQYIIEASTDGDSFTKVVDRSNNAMAGSNSDPIVDGFAAKEARYVRITVSGAKNYSGSWMSLEELTVLGKESTGAISVTSVSITTMTTSITAGDILQLETAVSPDNADNKKVNFSTDNTAVASVDENGLVTAVSEGKAVITVSTDDGGFTSTIEITVTALSVVEPVLSSKEIDLSSDVLKFYPNPSADVVNLMGGEAFNHLFVYTYTGKFLEQKKLDHQAIQSIDVSSYKPGLYIFRLVGEQYSLPYKITVK